VIVNGVEHAIIISFFLMKNALKQAKRDLRGSGKENGRVDMLYIESYDLSGMEIEIEANK